MPNPPRPANTFDPVFGRALRKRTSSQVPEQVSSKSEPHLRVTVDFLSKCASIGLTKDGLLLYQYMLLRCAPRGIKRSKSAHLYGDVIQKGEFFESKLRVAAALGKAHLKDKSKINWFGKTVKQLVKLGLVTQIYGGRRGYNATYLVFDVREPEPIGK